MARYAENTTVSSANSRAEIERTLVKYGASGFGYIWDEGRALIMFKANGRNIRFVLPLPDRDDKEISHTNHETPRKRTAIQIEEAYEQAVKQKWRALSLIIKAKLEAVESEIVEFDEEFGMHMVLPDGSTVRDHVVPEIQLAYETQIVRPFLAIEGAK